MVPRPSTSQPSAPLVVRPTALAVGGDAIARMADGKVVFVTGALPHELVEVVIDEQRSDFARGHVVRVQEASADRVEPSCPHVADGCGGCGWQHVQVDAQPAHKRSMVVDALRRTGRVQNADELVTAAPALPAGGHRTTVRARTVRGHAALRAARSNRGVVVHGCEVAHPTIARLLAEGSFGGAEEVTLRVGARTGDVLVLADPTAAGVRLPALDRPVTLIGLDEVRDGRRAWLRESVEGVTFRISPTSFFQTRPDGADALVTAVDAALHAHHDLLIDLYGGVGLFAATVGRRFRTVVSVEQHRAASEDAEHNLAGLPDAHVVNEDVDRWRPATAQRRGRDVAVVADPSRAGLGRNGVATVLALDPRIVVLVSCDAGSLGRDARLLTEAGWMLESSLLLDLFPHTPHVEVVSTFVPRRVGADGH